MQAIATAKGPSCGEYPPRPVSINGVKTRSISREELKKALDQRDGLKLVFVQGEWQFRAKHIPGSLNAPSTDEALRLLKPEDKIVVYCSTAACHTSLSAYNFLVDHGFKNVWRFAGGLLEWEDARYPLEGDMVVS